MLNIYLGCASVIFLFLTFIWSSRTWLNTFIKLIFFAMAGFSIFLLFQTLGYIVKV